MIGVLSYGGFLPRYRLDRKAIYQAMGWFNPSTIGLARGEKAVAGPDEDAITLSAAAARDCLTGFDGDELAGLYWASTTSPYQERQGAPIVAGALDLPAAVRTADFTGGFRAGTTALLAALDASQPGAAPTLIVAGESRIARAGSSGEHLYGDGAAALLVGEGDAIATVLGSHSVSFDFVDSYRGAGEKFDRTWEERWIRDVGFGELLPTAIEGLLDKLGLSADAFAKVVYPCRFVRDHGKVARRLGVAPSHVQPPLMDSVGDTGAAHPLLLLAAALEDAKPGDRLLVASFGDGCDVIALEVTEHIRALAPRRGVSGSLARRSPLASWERYAAFREMLPLEMGIRGETEAPTALTTLWRNRREVLGLVGSRCKACGTAQFPAQRVCVNPDCHAIDQMAPYRFAGRPGTVFTFTGDNLAFSVEPPAIYGLVDVEGGGRLFVDFTDCELSDVRVGQQVELVLRRKYHDRQRGLHGYFWKAAPVLDDAAAGDEQGADKSRKEASRG